jgi:hypothetical protein
MERPQLFLSLALTKHYQQGSVVVTAVSRRLPVVDQHIIAACTSGRPRLSIYCIQTLTVL